MRDPKKYVSIADDAIWGTDLERMPLWRAFPLAWVRVGHVIVRDMRDGQLSLRAMSLVYTTLLSLVPLLAISFSVLKGFGVQDQIQPLLLNMLEPLGDAAVEITNRIVEFVNNMKVGVLGAVGLGLLIYTVISLMQKIERAFNFVWRVDEGRSFARRFGDYLSVIMIGPVLAFASLGATASLTAVDVGALTPLAPAIKLAGTIVPYLLIVAAFAFVYGFMPNTKVTIKAAIAGALVAGLLWNVAGWAFASFVVGSGKYTAIYSAFATLIFFMIWLYVSWLILLIGADIAFYVQHPEFVTRSRTEPGLGGQSREALALAFALTIADDHQHGRPAPTAEELAAAARLPGVAVAPVIAALEGAGLIARSADAPPRFLPARALDTIPLKAVLDAVRRADAAGKAEARPAAPGPRVGAILEELDRAAEAALAKRTLRDLAMKETPR